MYEDYFRLHQKPFSIAPDPGFLYLSERHREALAHLMFGLTSDGGFVLITGEVGTGKTTLLRSVVEEVPENQDVAFILNPRLTVRELLESLCDELGIGYDSDTPTTVKHYVDRLTEHLLETHALGRSTVVIIDEAQNLSPAVLEQVRLLTNLETNERKLLRIILLGQPELGEMLERKELRQLAQRITARYHLRPLNREDTAAYVRHRLTLCGGSEHLFSRAAHRELYRQSKGVPRLINVLADRALLGAYVEGRQRVTRSVVRKAAAEVFGRSGPLRWWIVGAGSTLITVGAAWAYLQQPPSPPAASPAPIQRHTEPVPDPATRAPGPAPAETAPRAPTAAVPDPGTRGAAEPRANPGTAAGFRRPAGVRRYDSLRGAFAAAFDAWGVPFDPTRTPCNQATAVGLQCLNLQGTFDDIDGLDRPVVVELWDDAEDPFYAALVGVGAGGYRAVVGATDYALAREDIAPLWFGTYTVLWQLPPGYERSLRLDDVSPTVAWLRERLSRATGERLSTLNPNLFDARLERALAEFQRDHALRPDGIAGPHTLIRLNTRTEASVARLSEGGRG